MGEIITLNKITGLSALSGSPVIVYQNGKIFYYLDAAKCTFNLPSGEYCTESEIEYLDKPLQYIIPKLPLPEKPNRKLPFYDIQIGNNPHKASVNIHSGDILLDGKFLDDSVAFQTFVLFHEISHNLYFTEWKCDVYAAAQMLKRGFNPSQCYYSTFFCLSDKKKDRKEKLFNFLTQVKVK